MTAEITDAKIDELIREHESGVYLPRCEGDLRQDRYLLAVALKSLGERLAKGEVVAQQKG